jgi:GTPase
MSIYLEQEIEEGNIEYKRCLIYNNDERTNELITQMLWRVREGNGEAIYYVGVNDNGTFYNWTKLEIKQSIDEFKRLVNLAKLKIAKMTKYYYIIDNINNYYLKIVIREDTRLIPEKRIFLFGDTGVGKTTFLANLLYDKIDKEARIYLLNHKHEIIEKKTSSFNYNHLIYNDIKWVFIEGPGDDKYKKTRDKLFNSFGTSIDLCIFIEDGINIWKYKDYYIGLLNNMKIPYINLNIHTDEYNNKLIDKYKFFNNIIDSCKSKKSKVNNYTEQLEFVVLQYFKNHDMGIILSGILKTGIISENKKYIFNIKDKKYDILVKTIHLDGKPINKMKGPKTVSLCIEFIEKNNIKNLFGFISYHN